jgi:hypothetical protein
MFVGLSMAAIETQEMNELFGRSQASQSIVPALPVLAPVASDVLLGVSGTDLAKRYSARAGFS